MFELKILTHDAIPGALQKVERYRLLNEPMEAESICRDVLRTDPGNYQAHILLLLSLTDQFAESFAGRIKEAKELAESLENPFERAYYCGIVCERRAKAHRQQNSPGCGAVTYHWLVKAMEFFTQAEKLQPEGDEHALIRWNTCARIIMAHPDIQPSSQDEPGIPSMLE